MYKQYSWQKKHAIQNMSVWTNNGATMHNNGICNLCLFVFKFYPLFAQKHMAQQSSLWYREKCHVSKTPWFWENHQNDGLVNEMFFQEGQKAFAPEAFYSSQKGFGLKKFNARKTKAKCFGCLRAACPQNTKTPSSFLTISLFVTFWRTPCHFWREYC